MPFQPKEALSNIRLLSAGEKINHSSPKSIHMRLPLGDLAENNKENVRVFAEYFSKVLNNHKNTDNNFIINVLFHEFMT